jgi:hypothetical protein
MHFTYYVFYTLNTEMDTWHPMFYHTGAENG